MRILCIAISTMLCSFVNANAVVHDENYSLIFASPIIYPPKAWNGKIEGYAIVEFTILRDGSVNDLKIFDSSPKDIFDKYAIRTVKNYKFTPRKISGEAVKVPRVRYKLTYCHSELSNEEHIPACRS